MKNLLNFYFLALLAFGLSTHVFGGIFEAIGNAVNTAGNIAEDTVYGAGQVVEDVIRPGLLP